MGLLRLAFGAGLVVLLMPSDEAQQAKLYQNASYAVDRAVTFCEISADRSLRMRWLAGTSTFDSTACMIITQSPK